MENEITDQEVISRLRKQQKKNPATLSDSIKNEIIQIFKEENGKKVRDKHFNVLDYIPPEKLQNAINSYAAVKNDETAILLYDDTIFGNAKSGFLLTTKCLYCKNSIFKPDYIEIKDVNEIAQSYKGIFIDSDIKEIELPAVQVSDRLALYNTLDKTVYFLKNLQSEGLI